MTFVFLGLFIVRDLGIPHVLIFIIVTIFTFLGCWVIYELVKRRKWTRRVFGIKEFPTKDPENENSFIIKFCIRCGAERNPSAVNFCDNCGSQY
jgi:ribosomal protein L40E